MHRLLTVLCGLCLYAGFDELNTMIKKALKDSLRHLAEDIVGTANTQHCGTLNMTSQALEYGVSCMLISINDYSSAFQHLESVLKVRVRIVVYIHIHIVHTVCISCVVYGDQAIPPCNHFGP